MQPAPMVERHNYVEKCSIISVTNSLFINNNAAYSGGAVCLLSSTLTIEASGFLNNNAGLRMHGGVQ